MELSYDIIRNILLFIEKADEQIYTEDIHLVNHDLYMVQKHVHLMFLDGLIDVIDARVMGKPYRYLITDITMEGHQLLAILRKPKLWLQVQKNAGDLGISLTKDVIISIGRKLIKKLLENI